MGYRINSHPKPKPRRTAVDIATPAKLYVHNGTLAHFPAGTRRCTSPSPRITTTIIGTTTSVGRLRITRTTSASYGRPTAIAARSAIGTNAPGIASTTSTWPTCSRSTFGEKDTRRPWSSGPPTTVSPLPASRQLQASTPQRTGLYGLISTSLTQRPFRSLRSTCSPCSFMRMQMAVSTNAMI